MKERRTITIYLPATDVLAELRGAGQVEKKQEGKVMGSGRVLLMDDEESILDVMSQMLRRRGFEVVCTRDGSETITAYREAFEAGQRFDAVIMDLTIPGGMGGKEAITSLQAVDSTVAAIVSSGYSNDPIMADFRAYGFSGVVPKPYSINDLVIALNQVISAGQ